MRQARSALRLCVFAVKKSMPGTDDPAGGHLERVCHGCYGHQRQGRQGLNEDIIRFISKKDNEWMLEWRLEAYRIWQKMEERWAHALPQRLQNAYYYSPQEEACAEQPRRGRPRTHQDLPKLGISMEDEAPGRCRGGHRVRQRERGDPLQRRSRRRVSLLPFSEAVHNHLNSSEVPGRRGAAHGQHRANSAVFSDQAASAIPPGVRRLMEGTYFRINEAMTGQFSARADRRRRRTRATSKAAPHRSRRTPVALRWWNWSR
jgi:hypothetical protein